MLFIDIHEVEIEQWIVEASITDLVRIRQTGETVTIAAVDHWFRTFDGKGKLLLLRFVAFGERLNRSHERIQAEMSGRLAVLPDQCMDNNEWSWALGDTFALGHELYLRAEPMQKEESTTIGEANNKLIVVTPDEIFDQQGLLMSGRRTEGAMDRDNLRKVDRCQRDEENVRRQTNSQNRGRVSKMDRARLAGKRQRHTERFERVGDGLIAMDGRLPIDI